MLGLSVEPGLQGELSRSRKMQYASSILLSCPTSFIDCLEAKKTVQRSSMKARRMAHRLLLLI